MDEDTGSTMTPDDNTSSSRSEERKRREKAQLARGEVEPMSGEPIQPRTLDQMVSVRLSPDLMQGLRSIADARDTTLSAVLREAALMYVSTEESITMFHWHVDQSALSPASQGMRRWTTDSPSRGSVREVTV